MSRLFLLDTNMVSFIVKGKSSAARTKLARLSQGEVACISSITEGELWYGMARIGNGGQRRKALTWFLARLQVLPWGRDEAAAYGTLRAKQEQLGKSLGPLDTLLAAHAVAVEAIVVTHDRAFEQVPDLAGVENWATDV